MERGLAQRIVILGAGFGGIAAARTMARHLPPGWPGSITLVDQHNFFLFTPMLTEVAAGELDMRHIVSPVRQLSPQVRFEQGRIEAVDLRARQVRLVREARAGHLSARRWRRTTWCWRLARSRTLITCRGWPSMP
jgi:NADH dehydrogenase